MHDLANVTTVILAGGLGTRLRSVVAHRPKVLAEVQGRPFLAYLLDQVVGAGVRYAVVCTGYLGAQVRAMFGDAYDSLDLAYCQEPEPLGTAGALRLALPLFKSDPVLVMNGDSFCEVDLTALWVWHGAQAATATLLLATVPDTRRYGCVQVDEDGLVLRFDEKAQGSGPGWINAGVYLLSQRLVRAIAEREMVSLERQVFPAWIGRGLYGYRNQGRFLDIGTPEAYAVAQRFFASETPT